MLLLSYMMILEKEINRLLEHAIMASCSDIHFDVRNTRVVVSLRRHKHYLGDFELSEAVAVFERLRFMSGFDLARPQLPQTGSFSYVVGDFIYDFRFASLETLTRKHGVLRILNMNHIDTLRDSVKLKKDQTKILRLLKHRNGIVLFSGKTGSGKTTTMFNAVKFVDQRVVFSLENPIERIQEHCIQIEVSSSLSFEAGLTQLLRHDPDVIILGEIRSEEDIKQCIRCGLSGHLVLSTVHAGSIQHVFNRIFDLGASVYDLGHVLKGVIHQEMSIDKRGVHVKYSIVAEGEMERYLTSDSG